MFKYRQRTKSTTLTTPTKIPAASICRKFPNISEFLTHLGLQNSIHIFSRKGLQLSDLQLMDKQDLIELNVPIGPRNRILYALGKLDNSKELPEESLELTDSLESPKDTARDYKHKKRNSYSGSGYYSIIKPEVDSFLEELESLRNTRNRVNLLSPVKQRKNTGLVRLLQELDEKQQSLLKTLKKSSRGLKFLVRHKNKA